VRKAAVKAYKSEVHDKHCFKAVYNRRFSWRVLMLSEERLINPGFMIAIYVNFVLLFQGQKEI
jgi:hypothetical protein